jgi:hypothetical protein
MRRLSKSTAKISADSQRLVGLAQAVMLASSRLEERAWERSLDALAHKLLKSGYQDTVDAALDLAFKAQSGAYDALMDSVEAVSESCVIEHDGQAYDALLIAAPILAWTRFSIAAGPIAPDMLATLSAHLYAHILAPDARMAMAPTLYAIDQLPRTHADTLMMTEQLAQAALKGTPVRPLANAPETAPFLADTRYILAVVVTKCGEPLFGWQDASSLNARSQALAQWQAQTQPNLTRLLPGCGIELLLPEAYYVACREADKQIRPASIRAAVHYLTHALGIEANGLHAIIGRFGEDTSGGGVDEYRIGFTLYQHPDVVYGVVWPLYGQEDEESSIEAASTSASIRLALGETEEITPLEEILSLLRECGVTHIKLHEGCFPMESCEDCGTSLYLDLDAELVHAEMPDAVEPQGSTHLH